MDDSYLSNVPRQFKSLERCTILMNLICMHHDMVLLSDFGELTTIIKCYVLQWIFIIKISQKIPRKFFLF